MSRVNVAIVISLLLGVFWWVFTGICEWAFFPDTPFAAAMLVSPHSHEFWVRSSEIIIILGAGIIADRIIAGRDKALRQTQSLNSILMEIRNLGRLMMEAEEPQTFLRAVCGTLTARPGCLRAWVLVLDETGRFKMAPQSCFGDEFPAFEAKLKAGDFPPCVHNAISNGSVVDTRSWHKGCTQCQFREHHGDCVTLSAPMIHNGRLFGVLSVMMVKEKVHNKREQQLFALVAQDVALALRRMEAAEKNRLQEIILDGIQNQVTVTDLDGTILYVNRATSDALKRSPSEMIGRSIAIHGDDPERGATQEEILRETLTKGTWHGEVVNRTDDGAELLMDAYTWLVKDTNGSPVCLVGVGVDVTEQRAAADRLKASERKFRSLFTSMEEGVALHELICDEAGTPVDYRITDVNPAFEHIIGISRQEAVGSLASQFYGVLPPPYLDKYAAVAREGESYSFETFFTPMQKHFSISAFCSEPGTFVTAFSDISERKKAERLQALLYAAIEQSDESIMILDNEWFIEYVNPATERIGGYSREELIGKDTEDFLSNKHSRDFYDEIGDTVKSGKSWTGTLINRKKNGEYFEEETVVSPVFDEDGQFTHVVVVKRDMTYQRRLESQLRHSQRLEAVGKLAGGIAHDFNNVLQAIQGYTEVLLEELSPETEAHEFAGEIQSSAQRAANLVRQLLAFSRRQVLRRQNIDVNDILDDVLAIVEYTLGENIVLSVNRNAERGWIYVDRGQIGQVLMNLCVNARDAMPDGGQLTIDTSIVHLEHPPMGTSEEFSSGPYVQFSVTDTGDGMTEETLKHIFEPFFTTKEMGKGTGLGLATTYGIVNQHGGHMKVESLPGQGSTFFVYLPLIADTAAL